MKKNCKDFVFYSIAIAFYLLYALSVNAATAPGKVQNLRSTSHATNAYSNDPTIETSWSTPSGVATTVYYYYLFNTSSTYTIDGDVVWDNFLDPSTATTALSDDLSSKNGKYYFHVAAAVSDNGDDLIGETSTTGPYYIDTKAPTNVSISSPSTTNNQVVTLTLSADGATQMYISNSGYGQSGSWETYATSKQWELTDGYGTKTVYVQFRDAALNTTLSTTSNTRVSIIYAQNTAPQIIDLRADAFGTNYTSPNVYFTLYDYEGGDITLSVSSSNATATTPENITISGMLVEGSNTTYTITTTADEQKALTLTIIRASESITSSVITLTAKDSGGLTNTQASTIIFYVTQNLNVEFSNMSIEKAEDHMLIQWKTSSEVDTAGFQLRRSETLDGQFISITDSIIPAQGNSISGADYSYRDTLIDVGKNYYYQLIEIDLNGNQTIHPIKNDTTREGENNELPDYDANGDGKEDIADVIYLLQILTNFQKSE